MSKDAIRKTWIERVNEFNQSGQSQSEWCKQNNLNLRTFNYWYTKLKKQSMENSGSVSWMPLKVVISLYWLNYFELVL